MLESADPRSLWKKQDLVKKISLLQKVMLLKFDSVDFDVDPGAALVKGKENTLGRER